MLIFAGVFIAVMMTTLILRHSIPSTAGIDPSQLLVSFPLINYADAKEAAQSRRHNSGISIIIMDNCTVCLDAFEDVETLRLMPECGHVFHRDCVDAWLSAHTTCPYCRADLVKPPTVASNDVVSQL